MTHGIDQLQVSVIGLEGRWEVLIEVNGQEWKRYGPWSDRDVAELYAAEVLARARKVADRIWDKYNK